VRGAVEWYANGLQEPEAVRATTADYRKASNVLDGFYPGWLILEPGGRVKLTTIRDAYLDWSEQMGYAPYGEDTKWLARELDNRGLEVKKGRGGAMFAYDVRLTTEAERLELYEDVS